MKMPGEKEIKGCPACNGSGNACCVDYLWLVNLVEHEKGRLQIIFKGDGGAGPHLGIEDYDGTQVFFLYCPFCGKKVQ